MEETRRVRLVREARALRQGVEEATLQDLERPAQDVINMCRELYRLAGRIEERAKTLKTLHPEAGMLVLRYISDIDTKSRKMSRELEDRLGLL